MLEHIMYYKSASPLNIFLKYICNRTHVSWFIMEILECVRLFFVCVSKSSNKLYSWDCPEWNEMSKEQSKAQPQSTKLYNRRAREKKQKNHTK